MPRDDAGASVPPDPACFRCSKPITPGTASQLFGHPVHMRCPARDTRLDSIEQQDRAGLEPEARSQPIRPGQGDPLEDREEAHMTHHFVISRDQPVLFRHLRAHFADVSTVSVTLDLRRTDRRRRTTTVAVERRSGERRATPEPCWAKLGFVVASETAQRPLARVSV